ncbi:DUF7332 family protein [Halonotius roseus]|uniref:Uncharacterized protein n=1 Tax=Halonotius roseus TaxID=2511997 RepID=A0A544QRU1_9EURY|nr:hypothetical protein [Halonotius roseus]TQQ82163.1 hypothetical protein EWF95_04275 [Halonotius roseus]
MATPRGHRLWAVAVSLLLVTSPAAAVGGAAVDDSRAATTAPDNPLVALQQSDTPDSNACFPAGGYNFTIGTLGPQIEMVVHLSLLTNLGGPGTLGVELAGTTAENVPPMIELRTGVVFRGVTDVDRFLSDPFGLFAIAYEYRFNLPLGDSSVDYESDEPPISGPVGDADC